MSSRQKKTVATINDVEACICVLRSGDVPVFYPLTEANLKQYCPILHTDIITTAIDKAILALQVLRPKQLEPVKAPTHTVSQSVNTGTYDMPDTDPRNHND